MLTCDALDGYRDGELNAVERSEFEVHLISCADCRMRMSLLNNIVHILRGKELSMPDMAGQISRRAFRQKSSWDTLVISWLRPGPALAALAIVVVLISSLWMIPGSQKANGYSGYEAFMDLADAITLPTEGAQSPNDNEFVMWLEQEGDSQ